MRSPTFCQVLKSSYTGNYFAGSDDDIRKADCIIGQSFGTREQNNEYPGKANVEIAKVIGKYASKSEWSVPVIAQEEVADALKQQNIPVEYRITGEPSKTHGAALDSYGVLSAAKAWMTEHNYTHPLIVTHAHLMGRVGAQATILGINPILAPNAPRTFPKESEQWWTRQPGLWRCRETAGIPILIMQNKL